MTGCGQIGLGGGGTSNDPAPSGVKTKQGTFQGQNAQTVSGTASIYVDGTTVTLRLENLNAPSGTLRVVASASSTETLSRTLKGSTGNQNYTMSSAQAGSTDTVEIESTTVPPPSNVYGVATLQSTN